MATPYRVNPPHQQNYQPKGQYLQNYGYPSQKPQPIYNQQPYGDQNQPQQQFSYPAQPIEPRFSLPPVQVSLGQPNQPQRQLGYPTHAETGFPPVQLPQQPNHPQQQLRHPIQPGHRVPQAQIVQPICGNQLSTQGNAVAYPQQQPALYSPPPQPQPPVYPGQAPTYSYQAPPGAYVPPVQAHVKHYPHQAQQPYQKTQQFQDGITSASSASHQEEPQSGFFAKKPTTSTIVAFERADVRAGFIKKVFSLVGLMLLIVIGLICLFQFESHCNYFVRRNQWAYYMSYGIFLATNLGIVCCESCRRSYPTNIFCLLLLTLSLGYMTAAICCFYKAIFILIAAVSCTVGCGTIALFACQTKYDFTNCMGAMFVISLVLFFFGIIAVICSFVFHIYWLYIVYAGLACLLFMVYFAIDIQLIIGGKRIELSPEDYVLGATQIFIDIVMIFVYLLQILGYSFGSRD